ncbi:MAG: hypothetical protein U0354_03985 [Candidatus Sericytochromatia bacterium]
MHIYNNVLKLFVSAVVLSSYGCQADIGNVSSNNNLSLNTDNKIKFNQNYEVKDWSSSRVYKTPSFNIKAASSNLKVDNAIDVYPQPTDNKYLIDSSKLINSNNTTPSGRISTNTTTNEITGTLTYFGLDKTKKSDLSVGDKVLVLSTGETLTVKELLPETYTMTFKDPFNDPSFNIIPVGTPFISKSEKDGDATGKLFKDLRKGDKEVVLLITSDNKKLEKSITFDDPLYSSVKIESDKTAISPQKFVSTTIPKFKTTDSAFKIVVSGNNRGKSFASTSSAPAMELNDPTISSDNVLYYTSNNTIGANFFAAGTDGSIIWENEFPGDFQGAAPTFSKPTSSTQTPKTYMNKRIMYVASKSGDIYCINTDGRIVSTIKVNDSFKNSVWVDADDPSVDYVYAASTTGNLYRLKLDFSNPQSQVFSSVYSVKIADTSFYSSPVLNNSSLYIGGENGVLYEIIPNTGVASREWDLSKYTNNGASKIVGNPVFTGSTIVVPAGGYLFRIIGSTVTQSPLLELKQGLASRIKPYGTVFQTNNKPMNNIISSPLIYNGKVYLANGNAIFESDLQSVDAFKNYATYCVSISGRLDDSDSNIQPNGNGNLDISPVATDTTQMRIGMVDMNIVNNNSPYLNFFSLPLNSSSDTLTGYMPINEFDSKGRAVTGYNSNVVADGKGNVFVTLDNGSLNVVPTR